MRKIIIPMLLLTHLMVCAQNNLWKPGCILDFNGDTLKGKILKNRNLYKEIFFKPYASVEVLKYNPETIREFQFDDGKLYVSKEIDSSLYFLEYLIKGVASIYYLTHTNQYFVEKDNKLVLLKNSQVEIYAKNKNLIKQKKEYLGVLNYLLVDGDMRERIDETKFSHISLIQLSIDYHHKICNDNSCIVYEKKYRDLFSYLLGLNWEKGYLIDATGMKIEGYIQNKGEFKSSVIRFKMLFYDNSYSEYFPDEINEIHFDNGDYYISKKIENGEKHFLKFILQSDVNLYFKGVNNGTYLTNTGAFYIEKDNRLIELKNTKEHGYKKGHTAIIKENKEYLGILLFLLRDADIGEQIAKTELTISSLTDIFELYDKKTNRSSKIIIYRRK